MYGSSCCRKFTRSHWRQQTCKHGAFLAGGCDIDRTTGDTDVLKRIADSVNHLSESQRLVVEFLIKNQERAVFLTAARIGREVGVSESTVVRCAMALGYSGYPEFRRAMQEVVRNRLTTVDRLRAADIDPGAGESLIERVMRADMEYIEMTLRDLSREEFTSAVKAISAAGRVFVVGLRSASSMAFYLGYSLNWILRNVNVVAHNADDAFEQMMCAGPGDVTIGITFPRYTRKTVELVELARRNGARIVGITDSVVSPLASHCDILLTARSGMPSFNDSFVGPLSLINALIAGVGAEDEPRTAVALSDLESVWNEYQVYASARSKRG